MNPKSDGTGPKVVISGYYGFDNCGDEAVLLAMTRCLKKLRPDIRIVVLSNNPKKTRELYSVEAVNRWNPLYVALHLLSCQLVLSGGGSLLQDVTSTKSLRYYLAVINIAVMLGKRVMIYSQGIGPLDTERNRKSVSQVLNRCHTITVRDKRSEELLRELGVRQDIQVTCDPVMALSPEDIVSSGIADEASGISVLESTFEARKPLVMAVVRQWKDDRHNAPVAEFLDTLVKGGWEVLLVPAHYPNDMEALDKIVRFMTEQPRRLDYCVTACEFLALSAQAKMVFSMRLHGLICAFAAGTPMLGLSYDPKVDAFMEQAGCSRYCLPFDGFDCGTAESLLAELNSLPPQSKLERETHCREMRNKAWETARKAVELLD